MKKKNMKNRIKRILAILLVSIFLTGCLGTISNKYTKEEILNLFKDGYKDSYYSLADTLEKNDISLGKYVEDEDFENELYTIAEHIINSEETKEYSYGKINRLFQVLEEFEYKNNSFGSRVYSLLITNDSTFEDKLNISKSFKDLKYYKRQLSTEDIRKYFDDNKQSIVTSSGKGGYYDDKSKRKFKDEPVHVPNDMSGWHQMSTSVYYYGDFVEVHDYDEWVDDEIYQIHYDHDVRVYFKDCYLSGMENISKSDFMYSGKYLYAAKNSNVIVYSVDGSSCGGVIYKYPE